MNGNEILIGELNAELASLMNGLTANTSDYGDKTACQSVTKSVGTIRTIK